MNEPKSREGTQFGPYRLLRLLGKGGMGEVYEAEDTVKDRVVALKLLPEGASHDPVFRKRLQREAHSAGRLQEPHVVPIHDYGEIDGVLFVDMRMISGSDLRKLLQGYGPMTPARAVAIVRQIASALDAAHEAGIMHRDVKPENILVTKEDFAYLVDFGIANAKSDEKLTEMGTAVGTYAYMAPERFQSGEVNYRADIYALACVLHECLTGAQPFAGDSVSVVITGHLMQPIPQPSVARPGVPPAFDAVIARGMAKNPAERFASAGDMAMAATQALTETEQGHAETIVQRSEAATTPQAAFHQDATMAAPTPTPHPYPSHPPAAPPPPPPPPYGGTPGSFPSAPPPPYQPAGTHHSAPQPAAAQYGFTSPTGGSVPPPPPPTGGIPGGPTWSTPPGGSNTKGGKKTPWIPIAAIAGVLLLVIVAVVVVISFTGDDNGGTVATSSKSSSVKAKTSSSRTRTTTTEATPDASADESRLMSLVPADYPRSVCEPAPTDVPGALALVKCGQSSQEGGPSFAAYYLVGNPADLTTLFDESIKLYDELLNCPGNDAPSPTGWFYNETPDKIEGQIACGIYEGKGDIQWTEDANLVFADVQSPDLESLHTWWLKYS